MLIGAAAAAAAVAVVVVVIIGTVEKLRSYSVAAVDDSVHSAVVGLVVLTVFLPSSLSSQSKNNYFSPTIANLYCR